MRYLAIDYGNKRIGLAICDASETLASPLAVIDAQQKPLEKIAELVTRENVGAIVVGLPLNMDDSQGSQAKITMAFAERLKKQVAVKVFFQDERLSSFAAEQKLACAELSRRKKRKHLDAVAAAEILEAFLQKRRAGGQ